MKRSTLAEIAESAVMGEGTVVWQFATICAEARLGRRNVVGSCAWIGRRVVTGDDVRIQHGAFIPTICISVMESSLDQCDDDRR